MKIIIDVKEKKDIWGIAIELVMKLVTSPDDRIATTNTGNRVFEKITQAFLDDGGFIDEEGNVRLIKKGGCKCVFK